LAAESHGLNKKFLVLAGLLISPLVQGQNVEHQIVASQFGEFKVPSVGAGFPFPPDSCQVSGGGKNFAAFTTGVPLKIVDANPALTEIVTPVAVYINTCAVSLPAVNPHSSFYLTSGTGGLQEAILNGQVDGSPNTIILDSEWYSLIAPNSAATVIGSVQGNTALGLVDVTQTPYVSYAWNGTQYASAGSGTLSGNAGGGLSGTYPNPVLSTSAVAGAVNTLSVKSYGAACAVGTDDTSAYQAAYSAASALYASTGQSINVQICQQGQLGTSAGQTTINVGSGAHTVGPGKITVPAQSTNPLFLMTSTDDDSFDGFTITYTTSLPGCANGVNNAACAAIRYDSASPGTGAAHHNVRVSNVTVYNSGWGILIGPQSGSDSLSGITIHHNIIGQTGAYPPTSYQYNDGIHVGGSVSDVSIDNNMLYGRGDAGIAVSSELLGGSTLLCHDVTITGNVVFEGQVGIDNSGCDNLVVTGNKVRADISTSKSNPAFRSIYYANHQPINVKVSGNSFDNYQSSAGAPDYAAKFDCAGGGCGTGSTATNSNDQFTGNTIASLYVRGSQIDVSGNTFEAGGELTVDWDTTTGFGSYNVSVGPNSWQNGGTINLGAQTNVYSGGTLCPQVVAGSALSIPNASLAAGCVSPNGSFTTLAGKVINGIAYSNLYPGSSLDVRVNACITDAELGANGATSHICSSEGEPAQLLTSSNGILAQINVGDAGQDPVEWRLPAACQWDVYMTGGTGTAVAQYGKSSIWSSAQQRGGCYVENMSANGGLNSLYSTMSGDSYYELRGLSLFERTGGTLASNGVFRITGSDDNSRWADFGVANYTAGTVGVQLGNAAPCCSGNLDNFWVYGNDTGGTELLVNAPSGNGPHGLHLSNVSIGHPAASTPLISCTDGQTNPQTALAITQLYEESNITDTTTALNQLSGCAVTVHGEQASNISGTTPDTAPIWSIASNASPTSFHIDGLKTLVGWGNSIPAVVNNTYPGSAANVAYLDANGQLTGYDSNASYFDTVVTAGIMPAFLYSAAGIPLPACAAGIKGATKEVSDATSPAFLGAYSSGGGITAPVICSYNGSTYSWLTY
jgi:hypothetical protein